MKNKDNINPLKHLDSGEKNENSASKREIEYEWGKHPNSQKAIKKHQFKVGQVGNPLGRKPTFDALSRNLKKLAEQETFNWNNESQGTRKQQVLERIWKDAIRGKSKQIQLLAWLGALD